MQTKKGSISKTTQKEEKPRKYAETIRGPSKEEDMKTQEEDYRDNAPPRRFKNQYQQQPAIERPQEEEGCRRATPFIISSTPRYQTIFIGSCYSCYNFWHKDVNCRSSTNNKSNDERYTRKKIPRISHKSQSRSYNRFVSLSDEVECYKCKNF
jgi:hypothetical protein